MKILNLAVLFLLINLSLGFCQEKDEDAKPEKQELTIGEKLDAIQDEHGEIIDDLKVRYRKADGDEEIEAIIKERREEELRLTQEVVNVVEKSEKHVMNVAALTFMVKNNKGEAQELAVETLFKNYMDHKLMRSLVKTIDRLRTPSMNSDKWLTTILEKSPHKDVQARSAMALIKYYQRVSEVRGFAKARLAKKLGEGGEEYLEKWTPEKCNEEVERLAAMCIEKFSDVKVGRSTAGRQAERILAMANIKVGKVAPDILGTDLDGVDFKLSDYRGKVVMLDFWGDW